MTSGELFVWTVVVGAAGCALQPGGWWSCLWGPWWWGLLGGPCSLGAGGAALERRSCFIYTVAANCWNIWKFSFYTVQLRWPYLASQLDSWDQDHAWGHLARLHVMPLWPCYALVALCACVPGWLSKVIYIWAGLVVWWGRWWLGDSSPCSSSPSANTNEPNSSNVKKGFIFFLYLKGIVHPFRTGVLSL